MISINLYMRLFSKFFNLFDLLLQFHFLDFILLMDLPVIQNLHGLDVLDGCIVVKLVFVSAKRIQSQFLVKVWAFVLLFYDFQDIFNLLTVLNIRIVHSRQRMEDSPHDFWVVNESGVVLNIQAKNKFVQFTLLYSDSSEPERRR